MKKYTVIIVIGIILLFVSENAAEKNNSAEKPVLTLEQAINIALSSNRNILSQKDNLRYSKLSLDSAKTEFDLKITPDSFASISGGKDETEEESLKGGLLFSKKFSHGSRVTINPSIQRTGGEDLTYRNSLKISLLQPLFRGTGQEYNLSAIYSSEYNLRSAFRNLFLTQVSTIIQTVNAVYEIIRLEELIKIHQDSVQRLKGFAEAARIKKDMGMADPADLYRANQRYKQAQDNLISAQESLKNAQDNLKIILNIPIEEEFHVTAPLETEPVTLTEEDASKIALEKRIEIEDAEDFLKEKERASRIAKENTKPDLSFSLNYSRFGNDEDFGKAASFDQESWSISLSSATDLFRKSEKNAYQQSLLSIDAGKRRISLVKDEIITQVKNELRNLEQSEKRIKLQTSKAEEAKGQLELSRIRFKYGFANNFDLIEAETALQVARTDVLSAKIAYIVGTYKLRASIGTLLER